MNDEPIAVLSDIHGNVRALDAVLADIARRGIEQIVHLGDCLYGPFDPGPVAERLLRSNWPAVSGNEDRALLEAARGGPASRTARFIVERVRHEHIDWLARLPRTLTFDGLAFACHGTPTNDTRYLLNRPTEDGTMRPATDAEIVDRLGTIDAPLTLCGHDHLPRVVRLDDGRTIVNPGSVGCPAYTGDRPVPHRAENGSPRARYATVGFVNDRPVVNLIAIPYDWSAAAAEAVANGVPVWARWLRTGRATGWRKG